MGQNTTGSMVPVTRRQTARALVAVAAALLGAGAAPAAAATSTPNDPYFVADDQWGLSGATASINAPAAWCASTGAGIVVGDVDTGGDFAHPDLGGKLIAGARFTSGNGSETASGQAAVSDDFGHGSMTAGLITAVTDNGIGIAAVAPDSRVLVVKVLTPNGSGQATGSDADVAAGIRYAADHGARVINLSIGPEIPLTGTSSTSAIPDAINYAASRGVLVAVAAGNSSLPAASYSGIQNVALVVGALGPDGLPAYYSNSLAGVNLYAPGGNSAEGNDARHLILSTDPFGQVHGGGGYDLEQGTSFAAPHAAGVAALLMARGVSAQAARARIIASADSRDGLPELDAAAALGVSPGLRCSASTQAPGPAGGGGAPAVRSSAPGRPAAPNSTAAAGATATSPAAPSTTPFPDGPAVFGASPSGRGGSAGPLVPVLIAVLAALLVGGGVSTVVRRRRHRVRG